MPEWSRHRKTTEFEMVVGAESTEEHAPYFFIHPDFNYWDESEFAERFSTEDGIPIFWIDRCDLWWFLKTVVRACLWVWLHRNKKEAPDA